MPSELVVVAFVFARVTLAARAMPEHLQGLAADLPAWRHAAALEHDLRGAAERTLHPACRRCRCAGS